MKETLSVATPFNPTARTIDFSAVPAFDVRRLYLVFNETAGTILYAKTSQGLGVVGPVANGLVSLAASGAAFLGMQPTDTLTILYDVPSTPAQSADVAAVATKLGVSPAQTADVAAVATALGTPAQSADVAAVKTALAGTLKTALLPGQLTFTTIEQQIASGATYTLAADPTIKYLDIEVVDQGAVRFTANATDAATATHGKVLGPAASSPGQGGNFTFETSAVPAGLSVYALGNTVISITIGR